MAIFTVEYERILGPVTCLRPQQWTHETASGKPALCCRRCGGIYDLPDENRVDDGLVVPPLKCAYVTCTEIGYVRLLSHGEAWV